MGSKKVLFGSVFVLALMLMMPCISAIQQKTVEGGLKQELQKKLESIELNDLEDIKKTYKIKHQFLYVLIDIILSIRDVRGYILLLFSTEFYYGGWFPTMVVVHPILFLRSLWLMFSADLSEAFLLFLSELLGWNWAS